MTGFDASTVTGVLATAATPRDVLARLDSRLVKFLGTSAVRERFLAVGAAVQPGSPEELTAYVGEDLVRWVKVVKRAGIQFDALMLV